MYWGGGVEIRFYAFDAFWLGLKNVAVGLVHLLLAEVFQVVFRKLAGRKRKRGDALKPVEIFRSEKEMREGGTGLFDYFFEWLPFCIAARLRHQHKFTGRLPVRSELLDSNRFPVAIVGAREDVLVFFLGKTLDDFSLGERWRRLRLCLSSDTRDVMLRRRCDRPLRGILRAHPRALESGRCKQYSGGHIERELFVAPQSSGLVHRKLDARHSSWGSLMRPAEPRG